MKSDAIDNGFKQIFLDVTLDNVKATRFYKKHGFVFIGEEQPLASHPYIQVKTIS
ncbi:GNAT family N-acetyltransferase [Legionella quinlivanii]|uniref:GNAT family N-acetyltransferase n=1 Tax=Legionella quinlivanii TaxID=45073 RepID=UPI0022438B87|nr:GNAT family N-acetyltransferase [Legionella quinlivanii]MCW8451822.1 GNAT family N-acetyltransferase [Legionella quinlivanii]